MEKPALTLDKFSAGEILELLDIYQTEWCHRDELLWKQTYTFFYATLIVMFMPNIAEKIGITIPGMPPVVFPIVALVMALVFLYVSLGYSIRLAAIGDTYKRINKYLPQELRRTSISEDEEEKEEKEKKEKKKYNKLLSKRMSVVLCVIMFACLLILSSLMIVFNTVLAPTIS